MSLTLYFDAALSSGPLIPDPTIVRRVAFQELTYLPFIQTVDN